MIKLMLPLPVVPLIVAPSLSVIPTSPVPVPVNASVVAVVKSGAAVVPTAALAPPPVNVTVLPLMVPDDCTRLPAVACNVVVPLVVMLPPTVQLPVVLIKLMLPLPVVPDRKASCRERVLASV